MSNSERAHRVLLDHFATYDIELGTGQASFYGPSVKLEPDDSDRLVAAITSYFAQHAVIVMAPRVPTFFASFRGRTTDATWIGVDGSVSSYDRFGRFHVNFRIPGTPRATVGIRGEGADGAMTLRDDLGERLRGFLNKQRLRPAALLSDILSFDIDGVLVGRAAVGDPHWNREFVLGAATIDIAIRDSPANIERLVDLAYATRAAVDVPYSAPNDVAELDMAIGRRPRPAPPEPVGTIEEAISSLPAVSLVTDIGVINVRRVDDATYGRFRSASEVMEPGAALTRLVCNTPVELDALARTEGMAL